MILNIVLLILGVLFLFYGIKNKLKFWIIAGVLLLCLGAVSACADLMAAGTEGVNNGRIPFIIDRFMR